MPSAAAAAVLLPPAVRKARSNRSRSVWSMVAWKSPASSVLPPGARRRRGKAGHLVFQQRGRDVTAADQISPLQGVGQFADVPRPVVLQEPIQAPGST